MMREKLSKLPVKELRGINALIHDAVDAGVDATEKMHLAIARKPFAVLEKITPIAAPARVVDRVQLAITTGVYRSIRVVNRLSGSLGKHVIDRIEQAADKKV